MVILKETYQSIQKACWGNIPFKFQDVSLLRPRDSRGHNDPSHDPVTVGLSSRYRLSRYRVPAKRALRWMSRYPGTSKYPEPDPEPGYLASGTHRVAKPAGELLGLGEVPAFSHQNRCGLW
jgi:hypothetical protein